MWGLRVGFRSLGVGRLKLLLQVQDCDFVLKTWGVKACGLGFRA